VEGLSDWNAGLPALREFVLPARGAARTAIGAFV